MLNEYSLGQQFQCCCGEQKDGEKHRLHGREHWSSALCFCVQQGRSCTAMYLARFIEHPCNQADRSSVVSQTALRLPVCNQRSPFLPVLRFILLYKSSLISRMKKILLKVNFKENTLELIDFKTSLKILGIIAKCSSL